jgi:hypothetical protein
MAGAVFVGRPRPVWKVILYSLLTLGIYGRVHLYKSAKEIDGHEALFLDLRLWMLGVILPVGGPLVVKWRLVYHLEPLVRHDATAPRIHVGWLRAAAFIPWLPVYHALAQRHLSHHWLLHRKLADLQARREVLEQRRAQARTEADREEVRRLEADLRMREEVLNQAQEAALEIRDAQRARARAEDEIRAAGGGPSRLDRLRKLVPTGKMRLPLRKRAKEEQAEPETVPPQESAPAPTLREASQRRGGARPAEPAAPSAPPAPADGGLPDPEDPTLSKRERAAIQRLFAAKINREAAEARAHEKRMEKARRVAAKAGQPEPGPEPTPASEPSRKERKWQARYERARERRERAESKAREQEAAAAPPEAVPGPSDEEPKRRFGFLRRKAPPAPEADAAAAPPEDAAPATPEPSEPEPAAPKPSRARPRPKGRAKR